MLNANYELEKLTVQIQPASSPLGFLSIAVALQPTDSCEAGFGLSRNSN
jgi:hypothetical protein